MNSGTAAASISAQLQVNPGFIHMAAALMAMEHFNQRNASVVPELDQFHNCSFQFDVNNSRVFDSGSTTHLASRSLFRAGATPCAIAGPFHDKPAMDLSVMAQAAEFPLVAHRSFDLRTVMHTSAPYTSQVYPDNSVLAVQLVDFLRGKGRDDFVSILYPLTDGGLQWKDVLSFAFKMMGIESFAHEIHNPHEEEFLQEPPASISENMKIVKDRGFRTIVVPMENPLETLPHLADAAEECGMNNGDYFWVWLGDFSATHLYSNNSNISKLVYGSAYIFGIEPMYLYHQLDPFHAAFTSQGPDFANRVNALNPISPDQPGYIWAGPNFFTNLSDDVLEHGAGFLYDAVISLGMGACHTEGFILSATNATSSETGESFLRGIRQSDFTGASGRVRFQQTGPSPGARVGSTALLGAFNLLPRSDTELELPHRLTDVFLPDAGRWEVWDNFTYADGTNTPPALLRDPPPQNYLPNGLRILGFVLLGTVYVSALAAATWVAIHRGHRIVRAAQPHFLYGLVVGACIFASAIIPLSYDESYGWDEAQLSAGCMSIPWLVGVGHIVTYSALFAKLWRVNKVLQFTRRKVEVRHVVWPAAFLVLAALIDLALWTALDPAVWTRVEINFSTGESIGYCQSNDMWAFAGPLAVLMMIPTVLTAVMAYKTKDVDEAYSESSWIFTLILLQVELFVVGAPVVAILRTISTTGRYMGLVVILWAFPTSTLSLIVLPKVVAYRRAAGGVLAKGPKRGSKGDGRVSGVSVTASAGPCNQYGTASRPGAEDSFVSDGDRGENYNGSPTPRYQSPSSAAESAYACSSEVEGPEPEKVGPEDPAGVEEADGPSDEWVRHPETSTTAAQG